jgi:hypothetical protein
MKITVVRRALHSSDMIPTLLLMRLAQASDIRSSLIFSTQFTTVVFAVIAVGLTFRQFNFRARYMLAMTIGVWSKLQSSIPSQNPKFFFTSVYLAGIIVRFPLRSNPDSLKIFLIQNLAILLSPCAFIGKWN